MTACMKEVVKEATKFVSACYGKPYTEEMSINLIVLRDKPFGQPGYGKSGKAMSSLASLPPTTEAFYEKV
ncbi:hypothetical protein DPMN_011357 [Dreissena polymorpha]|uniref:Uncharacterized protein n=1 Tax=Dreissena polymorpha TaxID=45954 RepID=A0A9D4S055_DREPO|nr:hypothetical protein DPMN_011357 [Dreissena polymorpha]